MNEKLSFNVDDAKTRKSSLKHIFCAELKATSGRFLYNFVKKPCADSWTEFFSYATWPVYILLSWLLLFICFEEEALPGKGLFNLFLLYVVSCLLGAVAELVKLPGLFGMLVSGIAIRSLGLYDVHGVYYRLIPLFRKLSLAIILMKAGLSLDSKALVKLRYIVLRVGIVPFVVETLTVTIVAHYVLSFPWIWTLLLGIVISAVSPAIVVPFLLQLKDKGYGENKGIATLLIASSSVDNISAITSFGIVFSLIFGTGEIINNALKGLSEIIGGIFAGLIWGLVVAIIPVRTEERLVIKRFFMLCSGAIMFILGGSQIGFNSCGPLATISSSFIASIFWKWQGWRQNSPVGSICGDCWYAVQPMFFALIGAEINVKELKVDIVAKGLLIIFTCVAFRSLACCISTLGTTLNWREMLFCCITWVPKATVQGALGPVALDFVRKSGIQGEEKYFAKQLLDITVVSVLATATLGAIGIRLAGPKLLKSTNDNDKTEES